MSHLNTILPIHHEAIDINTNNIANAPHINNSIKKSLCSSFIFESPHRRFLQSYGNAMLSFDNLLAYIVSDVHPMKHDIDYKAPTLESV